MALWVQYLISLFFQPKNQCQIKLLVLKSITRMSATQRKPLVQSLYSLGDALTSDLDEHKFKILHPKHISLIKSPLIESQSAEIPSNHSDSSLSKKEPFSNVEYQGVPPLEQKKGSHEDDPDFPRLRYEQESSTIQLFYDLFFVANLTTFTAKHQVSDSNSKSFFHSV
jgi:hypothetical protein